MTSTPPERPGLTDEQERPLAVRGASVALSAGAGCGKTTVLTERFLRAIDREGDERRPLATIVAMTFTEKAARELRQRIRAACHERLRSATPEHAPFWRGTLRSLEAAPVNTFHEYCAGLLRRHALDAGLDPDFEVLDASIAGTVRDEALARCLRRWLAHPDSPAGADLVELAVEFGLQRVRESLADLVGGRDARALAGWVGKTPEQLVAVWERGWQDRCRPIVLGALRTAARRCVAWLVEHEFDHPKLRTLRSELLATISDLEARVDDESWLATLRSTATLPRGLRKEHWLSAEVNEAAKEVLAALRDVIDAWQACRSRDEAATLQTATLGLRFLRLASEARAAYGKAKLERGGLDFDDLLVRTLEFLFRHEADVRDDPDRPIEFVLVDEFQDTDPVQSDILRRLTGDAFTTGRLFVVGDFKQSIYRFRGARPKLFQDYRDAFPAAGRLDLSQNFRATGPVIDFVNALFVGAFPGEESRLLPGPNARPAGPGPAVALVWPVDETDSSRDKPGASELRRVEARWLARIIRTRLDVGWLVRDRRSRTGEVRNAHAGDVAFLFRAMTDVAPYEQALVAEGLDFHVVGGSAFYAQQEVQDLVNVLSTIEDPCDAVALAGALRSPFFALSDDGLYHLGASGRGDLPERLRGVESVDGLSDLDQRRAERARRLIDQWRALKDHVPIATLIDRVLDESGYEAALPGEFLGDRKRANARKLVHLARRFDARGGFTLAHFVARLRDDLREPPREGQAATTDEEGTSVRLMSIHQAKGLEFPIVVVPDLNRKAEGPRKPVAFDPELGPLVQLGKNPADAGEEGEGESLGWSVYQTIEKCEEEAEAERLFYVATTRARDALMLSAGGGPEVRPVSPAMKLLATRFDRVTGACLIALPDGWAEPAVEVIAACPPAGAGAPARPLRRASPGAVARVILGTRARDEPSDRPSPPRPRFVDLDEPPGVSPRAARTARLVRSVLADPAVSMPGALAGAVRRAARRQVPRAPTDLEDEVVRRLGGGLVGRVMECLAGWSKLERGVEWSVSWPPPAGGDATVVHGRAEFLVRDGDGVWSVVTVSPPGATPALERLRWVMSARAAADRGLAPLGSGWRIVLVEQGDFRREERFDDAAVEAALRAALESIGNG
jgi:ATP-dependent helicase/nuclease subunit A